jgi:cyclophilin family peptidyl-prolyl cis-trans isomerase
MHMTKALRLLAAAVVLLAGLLVASCSQPESTASTPAATGQSASGWVQLPTETGGPMKWDKPPEMMLDQSKQYRAVMETDQGEMVLDLFAKDVPNTVNNFVFLATHGFYDNTTFHRVIPGFMAQGGDPTGTGSGGPGYKFDNEITSHGHDAGALSMANAGPNTNGSQFFICYTDQHRLDGSYNVFGQLVQGMDVLEKLKPRDPQQNPSFQGSKLISVRIEVKEKE